MALFSLVSSVLPPATSVVALLGEEALGLPYRFEIGCLVPVAAVFEPPDVVGQPVTLQLQRNANEAPFMFHGVLADVELVHAHAQHLLYRLTLVPRLWRLSLSVHSRVFTGNSVVDIISAVLEEAGIPSADVRWQLLQTYPDQEHICQYRESDLDFIQRLMEREGLYYYFEQSDREVLVITDDHTTHQPFEATLVRYYPSPEGDTTQGQSLRRFRARSQLLPNAVQLRDYNYSHPTVDLSTEAPVTPQTGHGRMVLYGEHYRTPNEGARYAEVRAQELAVARHRYHGEGWQYGLRSGYHFTLDQHGLPSLNQTYLTVRVRHVGFDGTDQYLRSLFGVSQKDTYIAEVDAVTSSTPYRSPRRTPWPRIDGVLDGVVDGSGPYAPVDEHGRYRVRLFFDEGDHIDGSSSTWVRMLQPHGGGAEGSHFPLKGGTEVAVTFLGGHPDRPVIVGSNPNATKPSVVSESNASQHILRSPGQALLCMEDLAGANWVHLSSPALSSYLHLGMAGGGSAKNFDLNTAGDGLIHTGGSLEIRVDTTKLDKVLSTVTEEYVGPLSTTVNNDVTQTYEANFNLDVTGDTVAEHHGTVTLDVHGAADEHYHTTRELTIDGAITETFGATRLTTITDTDELHNAGMKVYVDGSFEQDVTGDETWTIGGAQSTTIDGDYTLNVNGNLTVNVAGSADWNYETSDVNIFPQQTNIGGRNSSFIGLSNSYSAISTSGSGLSMSTNVMSVSLNAVSISANFAGFSTTFFEYDNALTLIKDTPLLLKMGVLELSAKALNLFA